ncbi:MAG: hypothetical protein ACLGPM_06925 [Acidobacteriota bacterium]
MTWDIKIALRLTPALAVLLVSACASSPRVPAGPGAVGAASTGPAGGSTGGSSSSAGNSGTSGSSGSGSTTSTSSASNAAYVYVSSTPQNGSVHQIAAYTAAANGALTPVAGSPFQEDVTSLAADGSQLFAVNSDGYDVESYSIGSDGALAHETTTHVSTSGDCNTLGQLFVDRSGANLYALNYRGSGCANNNYESLAVNSSTGALTDLGGSAGNNWLSNPASFSSNDSYAYSASCVSDMYWGIYGFSRGSGGLLNQIQITAAPPAAPSGTFYCPSATATDGTSDVAIAMQPVSQGSFSASGAAQIATYTIASNGNLTAIGSATAMPQAPVGTVSDLKISADGTLLAVSGSGGLEVMHFSAGGATALTGLLTKDAIDQCFWDKQNHLYAISKAAGKLYVFTVSSSGAVAAPGSPYAVSQPGNLAVESAQ